MFEAFPRPDGSWSLIMLWRADGMTEDTAVRLLAEMDDALHAGITHINPVTTSVDATNRCWPRKRERACPS